MSGIAYHIPVPANRTRTSAAQPVGPGQLTGVSASLDPDYAAVPQSVWGTLAISVDTSTIDSIALHLVSGWIDTAAPLSWTGSLWMPPAAFVIIILQADVSGNVRLMIWADTGPNRPISPEVPRAESLR